MSVPNEGDKRGLSPHAQEFTATDGSKHYYFTLGNIWIFMGAGATNEADHAIAGASIPSGSLHINRTTGKVSVYEVNAWKIITQG